ncbi:MarR family transcriptional regulator [Skermanella stibiiresistens SB22]|uniref:MarR family transcriptional regulator n=1 Tax=Skermanella stibiiresistens SB22 TaxID=1385369 RepID=W9HDT7_9PROT|nr:helix-turn-helix domain-containing GNAT family N-acetyltransferase [Skermanella stibiiresistens]EWY42058.1 MarR family transcriptional regulator [Skermanella stibiiresistens SB22]
MVGEQGIVRDIAVVRRFSRFYTRRIGLLHEGLLGGPLTLTEGRLVYELAQVATATAKWLSTELDLDPGYLSRVLRGLETRGLIEKRPAEDDGRQVLLSLTTTGRDAFATMDARSHAEIRLLLDGLSTDERRKLVESLSTAELLLGGETPEPPRVSYVLRPPRPGDMGWVVHRHAVLYTSEYGWDGTFEAFVAEIVSGFIRSFDPKRENCWIAERDGAVVGSVFVVRRSEDTAKLRMLYVEPAARGLGIGHRLVGEGIRFARHAGYSRLTLWTNDILTSARRIYEDHGFRLTERSPHRSFGKDLISETWELDLGPSRHPAAEVLE